MAPAVARYPFEVDFRDVEANTDAFVSVIFESLESEFLVLPRGRGFVDYPTFETAYEALKNATASFQQFDPAPIIAVVLKVPLALVVLRTMLGFTPPELAYVASQDSDIEVAQGFVRSLDRRIRMAPLAPLRVTPLTRNRLERLVVTACRLLTDPPAQSDGSRIHRLDKADTRDGIKSIRTLSQLGVPYAMLLYERFLGRPFAGHRDSVSELVGAVLESAIEDVLSKAGVSYPKTKRAEKIPGFDQAPDFVIPSEFNPRVVIEAKLTEDDGTARDKVTRLQDLAALSESRMLAARTSSDILRCCSGADS